METLANANNNYRWLFFFVQDKMKKTEETLEEQKMKIYDENKKLKKMFCNQCGRQLRTENGMLMEAAYEGRHNFGYFSHKDGVTHSFDLCEACYDKLIGTFAIPVTEKEEFEWQAE